MSLFPFVVDGVHVLPVLHERLEYADCVRRAMRELRPEAVAVEIPSSLDAVWRRAVLGLPQVSVLLYENAAGRTIYLPVQPADPLAEASRAALELGIPVVCADLDVDGHGNYRDPAPDPYSVVRLGAARVYDLFGRTPRPRDPHDDRREAAMAYHARQLAGSETGKRRVLLVCGMHHAAGVAKQLGREQATPLTRVRRKNVRLVNLHPESLGEVLAEIPFHIAAYEARRKGLPDSVADEDATDATAERTFGPFRVLSGGAAMGAGTIRRAVDRAARAGSTPADPDADTASTADPAPSAATPFDRLRSQSVLLREAERALLASAPDETVRSWQRINLARFSRNLALSSGQLVPDLYDLLAAARSCVSENFAWELHRLATAFPWQQEAPAGMVTAHIRADEMYDGVRRLRLERRRRRPKRPDWRDLFKRGRKQERFSGEWLMGFDDEAICSYPPEDLVIENFGRYLQKRGKNILCEEKSRTLPFTTSVLDGIDVRETIRHWSEKRIFVREAGRAPGGVGAVVIIFDEDDATYPYAQTWLGEHDQESDMAFFSTDPAQGIVGPGICRVTYGGLMLSHPPRRMADVFSDPDYRLAQNQAEVLLLAALDYTTETTVVHVAAKPPRSILRQVAARLGLKILHIPVGTLSPTTVRRLRVMHILAGHDKRTVAKDYIW